VEVPDFAAYVAQMREQMRTPPPPMEWVLNPWEYDFIKKHVDDGCEDRAHLAFFSQCVRAERL